LQFTSEIYVSGASSAFAISVFDGAPDQQPLRKGTKSTAVMLDFFDGNNILTPNRRLAAIAKPWLLSPKYAFI